MKLSEIDISNPLLDEDIQRIVYSNIDDSGKSTLYGIVFGNSLLYKERVITALQAYRSGRIKKVIFCGGNAGVSNQNNDMVPEAIKMKNLAIKLGIKEEDILIDDNSNNSFENVDNAFILINDNNIDSISIITSEFHLKRCKAIINKKFPNIDVVMIHSKDGFSDSDNWFLSDGRWNSGRSLATYEASLLVKYAKEDKIANIEINGFGKKRK